MFEKDNDFMLQALACAQEALTIGEIPIGALIVSSYGEVIGTGYNMVETLYSQGEHAEARAMRAAGIQAETWRLNGCTLYVTVEPCLMCINLAALSRIERVVYGAPSPRFGFSLDKGEGIRIYTKQVKCITGGMCAQEAAMLLEQHFALARERDGFRSRSSKS